MRFCSVCSFVWPRMLKLGLIFSMELLAMRFMTWLDIKPDSVQFVSRSAFGFKRIPKAAAFADAVYVFAEHDYFPISYFPCANIIYFSIIFYNFIVGIYLYCNLNYTFIGLCSRSIVVALYQDTEMRWLLQIYWWDADERMFIKNTLLRLLPIEILSMRMHFYQMRDKVPSWCSISS